MFFWNVHIRCVFFLIGKPFFLCSNIVPPLTLERLAIGMKGVQVVRSHFMDLLYYMPTCWIDPQFIFLHLCVKM